MVDLQKIGLCGPKYGKTCRTKADGRSLKVHMFLKGTSAIVGPHDDGYHSPKKEVKKR